MFLGIDAGTSFIKAAAFDPGTMDLRQTARAPFPAFLPGQPPGHCEVDPAAVMTAVHSLLNAFDTQECEGLLLCGQMHGFVLVDSRGRPLSNYISWLDQRVSPADFEPLAAALTSDEQAELGNELRPSIAVSILHWLKQRNQLPAEATPVSIADFVAGSLCGTAPVMEPTQAAAFGALQLGTLEWHPGVIGKLGLEGLNWPRLTPTGSILGKWQGEPCYTPVGDQQCALAGALLEERELSANIGTGSQLAMIAAAPDSGTLQTRPYLNGRYLKTITHIPAGRALSALIGLLTELGGVEEEQAWKHVHAAVAAVPATDLRAGISFFPGPCGTAGFLENLHEGNLSTGHIFRAVFESMAANYATCAQRLDPERAAARLVFSGGVARNLDILRSLTATALNLPARLSPHPEDTLYGLMVLARAWAAGGG